MIALVFIIVSCILTGVFYVLISKYFVSKQYILTEVSNDKVCKETKIIGDYIDIKCGGKIAHISKNAKDIWHYVLDNEEEKELRYNESIYVGNKEFKLEVKNRKGGFYAWLPLFITLVTVLITFQQSYSIMNSDENVVENKQDGGNIENKKENSDSEKETGSANFEKSDIKDNIPIINNNEIHEIVLENDNLFQDNISVDWSLLNNENGRFFFEERPSKTGISVSVYQGEIDWERIKLDGIDYAIIRIGSRGYETGNLYLDARFNENINEAKVNDLEVGGYFYSQAINQKEMDEEIKMILDNIKEYTLDYPIGIGLDRADEHRTNILSDAEYVDLIKYFCIRIKQSGYTPMIMGKEEWFKAFPEGTFDGYLKLVTNVEAPPRDINNCIIWEYQESAQNMVDGIDQVEISISIYSGNKNN